MRHLIILAIVLLLAGCASDKANYYTQTIASWRGGNSGMLVQRWGHPDKLVATPYGKVLYYYETTTYKTSRCAAPTLNGCPHYHYPRPTNQLWAPWPAAYTCTARFEVNGKGVIIHTEIRGQACYGNENFLLRMRNPNRIY